MAVWGQARDTAPNAAAVKELDLDLSLWQPLIVDRQFVSWLVKEPTEQVQPPHTPPRSLLRSMPRTSRDRYMDW